MILKLFQGLVFLHKRPCNQMTILQAYVLLHDMVSKFFVTGMIGLEIVCCSTDIKVMNILLVFDFVYLAQG